MFINIPLRVLIWHRNGCLRFGFHAAETAVVLSPVVEA